MNSDLTFETNSFFDTVIYEDNTDYWRFIFSDKIYFVASGFWRLIKDNKITLVSLDHGHQFGLPNPIDLSKELKKLLIGHKLIQITVNRNTADLTLKLTGKIKLEIYIASSGYETYEFSINDKRYIGMGMGKLAVMDNI